MPPQIVWRVNSDTQPTQCWVLSNTLLDKYLEGTLEGLPEFCNV